MAIENLPTFSHVLAGGAGALIALSIASAVTRLRSRRAGSATAALEARLNVLEGEMPNKASVQAVASISTRLTVHEVGVQPARLDRGELAIGTDADGRVVGVQSKAEADSRAQALLQQLSERGASFTEKRSR